MGTGITVVIDENEPETAKLIEDLSKMDCDALMAIIDTDEKWNSMWESFRPLFDNFLAEGAEIMLGLGAKREDIQAIMVIILGATFEAESIRLDEINKLAVAKRLHRSDMAALKEKAH